MNMDSHLTMRRALFIGLLLWFVGTIAIRLIGQHALPTHNIARIVILYAVSFVLMVVVVPRICRRLKFDKERWFEAATLLILPTLLLDPFSCVFFPAVFPNLDPAAAGLFGGWMLICCGGGVAGVWVRR
jgi:Kef-type K+ transport system membrane component KefB